MVLKPGDALLVLDRAYSRVGGFLIGLFCNKKEVYKETKSVEEVSFFEAELLSSSSDIDEDTTIIKKPDLPPLPHPTPNLNLRKKYFDNELKKVEVLEPLPAFDWKEVE